MKQNTASDPVFRRRGLGGSDLTALFNISKYADVYDLWMQKRGLLHEDISQKGVIRRGNKLEPIVADEFEEERGVKLEHPDEAFFGDEPWMFAHPDRLFDSADGGRWGLEIKTAGREVYNRNIRLGLDFGYLLQCVYYLYITDLDGWVLRMKNPDSWNDHDFIIRKDEATAEVFQQIRERGDWFWDLVETATEPPMDKPVEIPIPKGGTLMQTETEQWNQAGQWLHEAQEIEKGAKEAVAMAKKAVQNLMNENEWRMVEGPVLTQSGVQNLRVYWNDQKGRVTYKGKEMVALLDELKELAEKNDTELLLSALLSYNRSQFTSHGKISRPFKSFWIKTRPQINGGK